MREVERDIRTRARRQRLVDSGEGRISGKGQFPHERSHAWTFLRKYKGRKFSHGSQQLWHTWDRPKEAVLLTKIVSLAIKALRIRAVEVGFLTNGAESGHRWILGAGPCVVQTIED